MSNKKLNIIITRSLLLLLVTGTFILLVGAVRTKRDKVCSGVDIQIQLTNHKGFIDEKEITRAISKEVNGIINGMPIKRFDLGHTEFVLEKNVWIKKAQLFFDNNEVLHVQVEQRIPVARIIDNKGASYYLDSTGFMLPLSNSGRADVPVFTNVPVKSPAKLIGTIVEMATCIGNDTFWLAQASQINVLPMSRFELYPAFGKHVVDLGDGKNPADKFRRLKLFYKKVSSKKGFDAYPKLSVAFNRQVLAVKEQTQEPEVDAGKAMQVFDQMVKTNRRTANDEKIQEEYKRKLVPHAHGGEKAPLKISGQSIEINNKGNPASKEADKKIKEPKAVMPRFSHN